MLLHDGGRAPNPRRVQIFLAEKGLDIERVQVDINKLETQSADFTAKNPMQRVPVLELADGTIISETVAICRYLEEIRPDPPLMGVTALDKALVEMWQRRMELNFLLPVAFAFRHLHPGAAHLEKPQVAEWGTVNQGRAREFMEFLDRELKDREFIAGDRFTIADITGIVSYQFLKPGRIGYPEDLHHLTRWARQIAARPSVA
ncbi:MAG: glutathione S-transferase [Nitratireductor sp.]|nr:glutathione S-transferase [Nitratireductor sp.]